MDKCSKLRFVLQKEWWPGAGSNGRHADFQGLSRVSDNHLTRKDVANARALQIPLAEALLARQKRRVSRPFATRDIKSVTP